MIAVLFLILFLSAMTGWFFAEIGPHHRLEENVRTIPNPWVRRAVFVVTTPAALAFILLAICLNPGDAGAILRLAPAEWFRVWSGK